MKTPTEFQLSQLAHVYDPVKAHDYYEKHKHLKGRQKGNAPPPPIHAGSRKQQSPKDKQKHELAAHIQTLELKLHNLEALIQKKEAALKKDGPLAKAKAKKNHATKAKDKPKTAADKAKLARDNQQYRDKHKQKLKVKAKQAAGKSGGGKGSGGKATVKPDSQKSIASLKALATKVKGQLAIAKQKLAAL